MFSYYGSKSKVIDLYPSPKYGRIIEPFAGSARYSLKYWDREIVLVDKYEVIIRIWKWLQKCSPRDILGLPRPKENQRLSEFDLSDEERLYLGFLIAKASQQPRDKPTWRATTSRPNNINFQLHYAADNIEHIKHWDIRLGDYRDVPNQEATWFIDPPYQVGGYVYVENNKGWDLKQLAEWCQSRQGQVIVCENTKATWLPFSPIKSVKGSIHKSTEAIWCNDIRQDFMFPKI